MFVNPLQTSKGQFSRCSASGGGTTGGRCRGTALRPAARTARTRQHGHNRPFGVLRAPVRRSARLRAADPEPESHTSSGWKDHAKQSSSPTCDEQQPFILATAFQGRKNCYQSTIFKASYSHLRNPRGENKAQPYFCF